MDDVGCCAESDVDCLATRLELDLVAAILSNLESMMSQLRCRIGTCGCRSLVVKFSLVECNSAEAARLLLLGDWVIRNTVAVVGG